MSSQFTSTIVSKKNNPKTLISAKKYQDYVVHLRRQLHQIPELSWEESKTIQLIKSELSKLLKHFPYAHRLFEKTGGLVLDIDTKNGQSRHLFRADIDALPITEMTELPFSSKHPGKMHACGHDCHTAMLLGAIKAIADGNLKPKNHLRIVFQRAEERSDIKSGGENLVEDRILDNISSAWGLHISSVDHLGTFISKPNTFISNSSRINIEITCGGGHVMCPQYGANAIDILTDLTVALRGFPIRCLGPNECISFVPAILESGNAGNIRPSLGKMTYSFRNFLSASKKAHFIEKLKQKVASIINGYEGASLTKFEVLKGFPTLNNEKDAFDFSNHLLKKHQFDTQLSPSLFCGEDFSYFLQNIPGCFWFLGAKGKHLINHHTPKFNPDESVLWQGVAFWWILAENL